MPLQTLPPTASAEDIAAAVEQDGAVIVKDAITQQTVQQMVAEVTPYVDATPMGRDDFAGRHTQRTGALVARTPTCRDLILHPQVLAAAKTFLGPYTDKILLHLTQTIHINPGNPAQSIHRDRLAWGKHIPKEIEPQFNTIWALTDFTIENGATRCVPGSHKWDWDRRALPEEIVQAEMSAGSVFVYSGSVLHSGGENRSNTSRLGLNLTYTLGWLRTEENQYLSCPPHIAKDLDPELQELLGYTQGTYALGYYSDPEAMPQKSDILPPEAVLGRKPRSNEQLVTTGGDTIDFSATDQL
jgi:ectoine hydroxylase-related dioxygenase (phytanoyl-CoA dioxygenase family)